MWTVLYGRHIGNLKSLLVCIYKFCLGTIFGSAFKCELRKIKVYDVRYSCEMCITTLELLQLHCKRNGFAKYLEHWYRYQQCVHQMRLRGMSPMKRFTSREDVYGQNVVESYKWWMWLFFFLFCNIVKKELWCIENGAFSNFPEGVIKLKDGAPI